MESLHHVDPNETTNTARLCHSSLKSSDWIFGSSRWTFRLLRSTLGVHYENVNTCPKLLWVKCVPIPLWSSAACSSYHLCSPCNCKSVWPFGLSDDAQAFSSYEHDLSISSSVCMSISNTCCTGTFVWRMYWVLNHTLHVELCFCPSVSQINTKR